MHVWNPPQTRLVLGSLSDCAALLLCRWSHPLIVLLKGRNHPLTVLLWSGSNPLTVLLPIGQVNRLDITSNCVGRF